MSLVFVASSIKTANTETIGKHVLCNAIATGGMQVRRIPLPLSPSRSQPLPLPTPLPCPLSTPPPPPFPRCIELCVNVHMYVWMCICICMNLYVNTFLKANLQYTYTVVKPSKVIRPNRLCLVQIWLYYIAKMLKYALIN